MSNDIMSKLSVGKKILLARRDAGFNQQSLADKIGTSSRTIMRFEKDISSPTVRELDDIARATKKTLLFLLSIDDDVKDNLGKVYDWACIKGSAKCPSCSNDIEIEVNKNGEMYVSANINSKVMAKIKK